MKKLTQKILWIWQGRGGAAATINTLLSRVLMILLNTATGIITARSLGPDGRGEQAAMILWPQFLAYALTLGLPAGLIYNFKKYPTQKSQILAAATFMGTILGLVASLIGIIFLPQWLSQYSPEVIHYAQWFMVVAPLSLLSAIFAAALEAEDEFKNANQSRYFLSLSTFLILIFLVIFKKATPLTCGLAYVIPSLPISFWMLKLVWQKFKPRWDGIKSALQPLLSYGLRCYGIDLIGTLSWQLGQAMVVTLLSAASMGMYTVALSLTRMLNIFAEAVSRVLLPRITARPLNEVLDVTGQVLRLSSFLTTIIAIPLMLFGPFVVQLFYGHDFVEASNVFRILLLEVIISSATWILSQGFIATGKPGNVTLLEGLGLITGIVLINILIPKYGLIGAGLSLLGSTSVRFVLVFFSYPLILHSRPPKLIIGLEDLIFLKNKLLSKLVD